MMEYDQYWYWLNNIVGVGRQTIRYLLEIYGDPQAVYEADVNTVAEQINDERGRLAFLQSKDPVRILEEWNRLKEKKITFIHPESRQFPSKFMYIPDAPLGLYYKGSLPQEGHKAVAIIGARNCTRYGIEMARFFGRELAKCNIDVISGLARGIDGMAHTGALEGQGYTLGILGCGIDVVYPNENYRLFMQMERSGGIMSEYNIGLQPFSGLFPQRNRLISGMADGVLVIEAMEKSGTFITVDHGLDQGKEIFAIPGRLTDRKSAGCNNLIKLGAHVVTEVTDILDILHSDNRNSTYMNTIDEATSPVTKVKLAPNEKMVYSCLRIEPKYLDDIIHEVQIAPQDVCRILNQFVMNGWIVECTRNYYAIKL